MNKLYFILSVWSADIDSPFTDGTIDISTPALFENAEEVEGLSKSIDWFLYDGNFGV